MPAYSSLTWKEANRVVVISRNRNRITQLYKHWECNQQECCVWFGPQPQFPSFHLPSPNGHIHTEQEKIRKRVIKSKKEQLLLFKEQLKGYIFNKNICMHLWKKSRGYAVRSCTAPYQKNKPQPFSQNILLVNHLLPTYF